jgi:ATP-dependent Clp protease protease subunit
MAKSKKIELEELEPTEKFGPALLFSDITADSALEVVQWIVAMNMLDNPPKDLSLMINSEGGDLAAGMAIIEAVIASKIPIKTYGVGQIQSAGLLIFMAGAKGHRTITPTCMAMTHHFNTGSEGSYSELKNLQKEYDRLDLMILDHYIQHTGLDEDTIRSFLVTDHDVYLSPEQVVEFNLADRIGRLEF